MKVKITVENATPESFAPYGRLIPTQQENPDKSGPGWKCWVPLGLLKVSSGKLQIGMVELEKQELVVSEMERHETREEMLWPIDKPIIQLVGLPSHLDDPNARPRVDETKAFLLVPGQIVIMSNGTWHAPSYALTENTSYYYAIELSDIPEKDVQPWRKFSNDETIMMVVEKGKCK